jgi:hypothetical protein
MWVQDQGAGRLGFADTAAKADTHRPPGLDKVAGDAFAGGATIPMVPRSWQPDTDEFT